VGGVARSFRDSVARTSRRSTGARATRTEVPPPRVVLPRVLRDEESLGELELESFERLDELERESSESRSRDDPRSSLPRAASLMRPSCALEGAASTSTSATPNHTAPTPRIPLMLRRLTRTRTRIRQGVVRIGQAS
jgi:hypothetical protein